MEDNITLQMQILKDNIIRSIQQSKLPISVVYYIVNEINRDLEYENNTYTQKIINKYNEELKLREKEENDKIIEEE